MQTINKTSRRSFLEKMTAGVAGLTVFGGIGSRLIAQKNPGYEGHNDNQISAPFVSKTSIVSL